MATTLTNLITRVRERTDEESSTRCTDTMITAWLNTGGTKLHDLVVAANPDEFLSSADFTLTGGTETLAKYQMSTAFKYIRRLIKAPDTPQRRVCKRWELGEVYHQDCPGYRLMGSYVVIEPYEFAAGTYRIWYTPGFTALSSGSDTLSGYIDQWEEYVITFACIKVRQRNEEDPSMFMADLREEEARVRDMATRRDQAHPPLINEVIEEWPFGTPAGGGGS